MVGALKAVAECEALAAQYALVASLRADGCSAGSVARWMLVATVPATLLPSLPLSELRGGFRAQSVSRPKLPKPSPNPRSITPSTSLIVCRCQCARF